MQKITPIEDFAHTMPTPVFYDFEASGLDGYPIEVGWAFTIPETGEVHSESHLIKPPEFWPVKESWERSAERLHGISLDRLKQEGRPAWEVAQRMNAALAGRELFSDAPPYDETWMQQLFDAAGLEPTFTIRQMDARVLIRQAAIERGLDEAAFERAKTMASELAPRRHRAEADARNLAELWNFVVAGIPQK